MCGPYTESHAHQDQGSFLIFKRGWLAYDQNINSHSGIVQETTVHNLVRVDQGTTTVAAVRFGDTTPGATVDWTRANGTAVTSGPRTLAVEVLPLMR